MEILRRLNAVDLQANFQNLRASFCKEKVAMEIEKPCGCSRFVCANSLPAFLFETGGTKRKANKREMPYMGRRPIPRDLLKKVDQNFPSLGECEQSDKSKFEAVVLRVRALLKNKHRFSITRLTNAAECAIINVRHKRIFCTLE